MNLAKTRVAAAALAAAIWTTPAQAQVPTVDVGAISQMISQLQQMQAAYDQATSHLLSITGIREFAALRSTIESFEAKLPRNPIEDLLNDALAGGGSGPLNARIEEQFALFGIENLSVMLESDKPVERAAAQAAGMASVTIATGEAGHAESSAMLDRAAALRAEVGRSADLKESVDLNTLALTEMMHNQAMITQLLSVQVMGQGTAELSAAQSALNAAKLRVTSAPRLE